MKPFLAIPVVFALTLCLGCESKIPAKKAAPTPPAPTVKAESPGKAPTPVKPTPSPAADPAPVEKTAKGGSPDEPPPRSPFGEPTFVDRMQLMRAAPPIPTPPKWDDTSVQTELLPTRAKLLPAMGALAGASIFENNYVVPDTRLILERHPDGRKRILFGTEVCLREGPLEVFVCKSHTKEHEAILRVGMDARYLHAALIATGAKVGTPVQFVNPKNMEPEYKAATGAKIDVKLHYLKNGKLHTHPAQQWIREMQSKKTMTHNWVFAGSRFMKIPDDDNAPEYYCANNGDVIGISNSFDAMLDIPVAVSRDDASLLYQANTEMIPPLFTKVWVILEPSR